MQKPQYILRIVVFYDIPKAPTQIHSRRFWYKLTLWPRTQTEPFSAQVDFYNARLGVPHRNDYQSKPVF
jgi:hypothetical protein